MRKDNLPVTFYQKRIWFLQKLHPEKSAFNLSALFRINGPLNFQILQQALNRTILRHDILHAAFIENNGSIRLIVHPDLELPIVQHDLSAFPQDKKETELEKLLIEERTREFVLSKAPLIRSRLIKINRDESVFCITFHQMIADENSIAIFIDELLNIYQSLCDRENEKQFALPPQFSTYARQEINKYRGKALKRDLDFWENTLNNYPSLNLPLDFPRPEIQAISGKRKQLLLNESVSESLRKLCRKQGCKLFELFFAAFQVLLYNYTGQTDLLTGVSRKGRGQPGTENIMGPLENTLVFRFDLSKNPEFINFVNQVNHVHLDAENHYIPFELIVDKLKPSRTLSHNPIFQVSFSIGKNLHPERRTCGLVVNLMETSEGPIRSDLELHIVENCKNILLQLDYNPALFAKTTIERMLNHYQTLLKNIVVTPSQPLLDIPVLSKKERKQILVDWNSTAKKYPHEKCIHELFEAQVRKMPDAPALIFEDDRISYRELDLRANQLANYLRKKGVSPEVVVGIFMDRSPEVIISIFAILKAGGAYLPLDPSYPEERLSYMISDAGLRLILTSQNLKENIPENEAEIIDVDSHRKVIEREKVTCPAKTASASNLAYMIYTSGSTGKPKGTLLEHRGLCNLATAQISALNIHANSRVLQFSTLSFDASVWEIFSTLICGGALVLASQDVLKDPERLVRLIREKKVTQITLAPSFLKILPPNNLPSLETVISAGEKCTREIAAQWYKKAKFINAYGPTEYTVCATLYHIKRLPKVGSVPIGRPINNTSVYILNSELKPVPIGVEGELFIGGAGLARGYHKLPKLTRERFITNPFANQAGNRLYRTGDLARYSEDGNIEFIGRIDHQVKIRGYRIELSEIETALNQHPEVKDSTVIARKGKNTGNRLLAYIISNGNKSISARDLRFYLMKKLPDYMIPSAFMQLESFPKTPGGKIDRNALPEPGSPKTGASSATEKPHSPIEKKLTRIWSEVLRIENIGVNDNFFELGGDSILSIQIVSRAKSVNIHITPKQLFRHPTIAELARISGRNSFGRSDQGIIHGRVPLTPIEHWFFNQNIGNYHHFNQSVLLELPRGIDLKLVEKAWQSLLKHHDALRLKFRVKDGSWLQRIMKRDNLAEIYKIDLSELTGEEQQNEYLRQANHLQASLNLEHGPLLRLAHISSGSKKPEKLLIIIHHLAIDSVSWRILLEDFQNAYQQLSEGQEIHLPEKTNSFKEWAETLHTYARSDKIRSELNYWLSIAAGEDGALPCDFNEGENTRESQRFFKAKLTTEDTQKLLKKLPGELQTNMGEVLLSALSTTFTEWTGNNTVYIDLESHGREEIGRDIDVSRTVGWFTSIFPFRLEINDPANIQDALTAVKKQFRSIPEKGIGYGLLRYLSSNKKAENPFDRMKTPQVSLNYLGQMDAVFEQNTDFRISENNRGIEIYPGAVRTHLIEIECMVLKGQLIIEWVYSINYHRPATIEKLAYRFIEHLQQLIQLANSMQEKQYLPSDFPLAGLDQKKLEKLASLIDKDDRQGKETP